MKKWIIEKLLQYKDWIYIKLGMSQDEHDRFYMLQIQVDRQVKENVACYKLKKW